jgi:hypothetical protein
VSLHEFQRRHDQVRGAIALRGLQLEQHLPGIPAVAWFKKPMICCSLYLLVLMSVILQKDGLALV